MPCNCLKCGFDNKWHGWLGKIMVMIWGNRICIHQTMKLLCSGLHDSQKNPRRGFELRITPYVIWASPYVVRWTCSISEQCGGNSAGKITAFISLMIRFIIWTLALLYLNAAGSAFQDLRVWLEHFEHKGTASSYSRCWINVGNAIGFYLWITVF